MPQIARLSLIGMGMVERKMRFPQTAWKLIQEEARAQGISATEFVRTSALAYSIYLRGERGEHNPTLDEIIERLRSE